MTPISVFSFIISSKFDGIQKLHCNTQRDRARERGRAGERKRGNEKRAQIERCVLGVGIRARM